MLEVNLTEPDYAIANYVAARCSGFGKVVSVKIHRSPKPFALVEMAHHLRTIALAGQYKASAFGNSVMIHLRQK
jgi:hypothetical protein